MDYIENDSINHGRIGVFEFGFSPEREPMFSDEFLALALTGNKRISSGSIIVFFVKCPFCFAHDHCRKMKKKME